MKIYNKVVIDIETGIVISEDSYNYSGPISKCLGGGGSSGGGGTSGKVEYPAYMETFHSNLLTDVDTFMTAAQAASPFTGANAYDPDADITAMEAAVTNFAAIIAGVSDTADWVPLFNQAVATIDPVDEAYITADVAAFAAQLDDQINTKVLPEFQVGMRNVNAVVSSAFVIGESIIRAFRDRDVAKHSSSIRIQLESDKNRIYLAATEQMLKIMMQRLSWEEVLMKTAIEVQRLKIVAKKEELDSNLKIDESDALWDLNTTKYGCNALGSIAGTAVATGTEHQGGSPLGSVIGGALSGAAMGAMSAGSLGIGAPIAAIGGGILGAAGGLFGGR